METFMSCATESSVRVSWCQRTILHDDRSPWQVCQSYLVMAGSQGAPCRSSVSDQAEFPGSHLVAARQYRVWWRHKHLVVVEERWMNFGVIIIYKRLRKSEKAFRGCLSRC